jgi:UDP-N-acetylmuramyl tripeptide synthase
VRLVAAVVAGKLVALSSRHLNLGGGTTFPGEITRRIDPHAVAKMSSQLRQGCVVVTGTNGKTTTTRMISNILRVAGLKPVHNRSGANLINGVTSALLGSSSILGRPIGDIGLFEVDEANLPKVVAETQPSVVVINNLFRDQLDRFGEINYLASIWRKALQQLPSTAHVVLNSDDPLVASLSDSAPGKVLHFGIEDERYGRASLEHAADSKSCVKCGARYAYSVAFYGHVGKYACPACGAKRPVPALAADRVTLKSTEGAELALSTPAGPIDVTIGLPGLYNVYNALAAAAAGVALGLPLANIKDGIGTFSAAFGRIERIHIGEKLLFLALVKNPVGFNEVLRTVLLDEAPKDLMIVINDNIADGTDISWLWDVDFEMLQGRVKSVIVSGTRAEDMAMRLKYSLIDPALVRVEKALSAALDCGLANAGQRGTLYILPTYTAMLEVRAVIEKMGYVGKFWQD